jgi:hypothetical protein
MSFTLVYEKYLNTKATAAIKIPQKQSSDLTQNMH